MREPDFETLDELTTQALDLIAYGDERRLPEMQRLEPRLLAALDEIAPSFHPTPGYESALRALGELRRAIDVERIIVGASMDDSSDDLLSARSGIVS
ncbi:MAG: hypothetical protein ABI639_08570 [Thermoanaerobaculia bacterium]